jgi:signal transduction histidine kinase
MSRSKNREYSLPKRYLFVFFGLGGLFILQMAWWIIFFYNNFHGEKAARYLRMLLMEGAFFVTLLLYGLYIIYRALRQQVMLRQQYRDFFAGFSHELKTPIASMKLQIETIQSLPLSEEKRSQLLSNMLEDLDQLELTIENILDTFRFESGALQIETTPLELDNWLERNLRSTARAYSDKSLEIRTEMLSGATVMLDERYFIAVVANLVQNCVRYSKGDPSLLVSTKTVDEFVEIRFSDKGLGIPPEELEQVFNQYFRSGENSIKHKGSGLGLYLSRQIVSAHGGKIFAQSAGNGKGTDFVVQLPLRSEDGQ